MCLLKLIGRMECLCKKDVHLSAAKEIIEREETGLQPKIELLCEPKSFYEHTIEDFKFTNLEGIKPLTKKLEVAI